VNSISEKVGEMKENHTENPSSFKIREDMTLTVTTLKKYLYFV